MSNVKFATAINCIDGRVQLPVIEWLLEQFEVDYVDVITEPGCDKVLAERSNHYALEAIRKSVNISLNKHQSKVLAVAGHYDCAGNPVSKNEHLQQIMLAVETVKSWDLPGVVIGLWVDENWKVHRVA
ncbi:hypothetical protein GGQ84_000401 [Desulfitispora alkaliphila]|uniref:carbonic anhydrase n=1 Tax=Desulfitispora alkaliphila TaxID=622674 RepID=UPI003D20ABE3